jgi:hypothetical protein
VNALSGAKEFRVTAVAGVVWRLWSAQIVRILRAVIGRPVAED